MNYNTLSTLFSQRALAVVTMLSLIMSAFPASFFVPNIAEAAVTETLSVTINPETNPERVTLSYAGASSLDLAGWTIEDAAANAHTISAGVIDNATDFVLCQNSGDTTGCDELWGGSPVWNNDADVFFLKDTTGRVVFTFTFGDVDEATEDFDVNVLDGKDSVEICHSGNGKNYVSNAPNVDGFINLYITDDKNGHHGHDYDIIPPFFYSTNDDEGYYPGKNWNDDNEAIWDNDCKDPDADYATINLVKVVTNENDPDLSQFDLTIGGDVYAHGDAVSVEIESNGGDFFTVSETNIPTDYALLGVSCKDDSKDKYATGTVEARFKLKADESYTCTITNEKDVPETGSITIVKVAGNDTTTEFDFDGDLGSFKLTGGASTTFDDLDADSYEVYELAEADWSLLDVTCTDGSKWDDDDGVEIGLDEGEDVTCTFTNRPDSVEPPVCKIGENLLSNASFEDPVIGGSWLLTNITDWVSTKVSNGTATLAELWRGLGVGASDGEQNVELGANEATILTQSVTTIPGATYELRFDFAARKGTSATNNSVDALIDGVVIMNASGTETAWQTYSQTFVADDASTDIAFKDVGIDDSLGSLIDNTVLCLVKVPEPEVYSCELGMLFLDTETDAPDTMSLYTVDETDGSATFFADYDLELHSAMAVDAAGVVYSIEVGTGNLVTLDDDAGAYTVVGATGLNAGKPVAMEVAPDGTLYVLTQASDKLYEVNTANGAATLLHSLDLNVDGGDIVFEDDMIVYIKNTGQVYGIDDTTYDETLLGTIAVGVQRITSAATKEGVHYAYTRQDGFYPFTLNPFVASAPMLQTGPFAWGDGSFCPAEPAPETGTIVIEKLTPAEGENTWFDFTGDFGDFKLLGNSATSVKVTVGEYTIEELVPAGWELAALSCDVDDEVVDDAAVTVVLEKDETITCQFGNRPKLVCEPGVNLIANGGFEAPVVTNTAKWDIFDLTTYPGLAWMVDFVDSFTGAPDEASLELHRGVNGWLPALGGGAQYAELDADWQGPSGTSGEEASVVISQTIETIPGETYTLSWDFSPRPNTLGTENKLLVAVDGNEVDTNSGSTGNQTDWSSHSYSFVADDDETIISFADDGEPNSVGTFVDNVGLYCRPAIDTMCSLEIVSDTNTVIVENNDYAVPTYEHSAWTALIDNASWIWEEFYVSDTKSTTTLTFKETFEVDGGMNALLEVAADNTYKAYLNGFLVIDQSYESNNFSLLNKDDEDVTSYLVDGENTLLIEVTNLPLKNSSSIQNPAGVLYRLTLTGTEGSCAITTDVEPQKYWIDGYKWNDEDGDGEWDGEEKGIKGWTIYAYNEDTDTELATTTDADGYYWFEVTEGEWEVYEGTQSNWYQTFPLDPDYCTFEFGDSDFAFARYDQYDGPSQEEGCNFGNQYREDGDGGGGSGSSAPRCNLEYDRDGNEITLMWTTSRANELVIFKNGDEIYETDDDDEVDEGEIDAVITDDTQFELVVKRGSRERTCEVEVLFDGGAGGDLPEGRVAGEQQTRIIPVGPADAGAGGASRSTNAPLAGVLIIGLAIVFGMRFTKVNG